MTTKSKLLLGTTPSDLQPSFRAGISQIASLPSSTADSLATLLVEDAKNHSPTNLPETAREINKALGIPYDEAHSLAGVGRRLGSRIAVLQDKASDIADDLVLLEVIPEEKKQNLLRFLETLEKGRAHFLLRSRRQEVVTSGGYHLAGWSVSTEFRAAFAESDYTRIDPDDYVPQFIGFIPAVTLEIHLHGGEESTKNISIRLPETDLASLEQALKIARTELEAAKTQLPGR